MIKNKIIRRLTLLLSLIILLTSTVNTTYGFVVTKTDSIVNFFLPADHIKNNLIIKKAVEHPFGEKYVIPDNIGFDFKVDFGALYAKTTINTTSGDVKADETGSVLVSVFPQKPFEIKGIDSGTKVTITEIQKQDSGFAIKGGAATQQGIVAEDGSLTFEYINEYTPAAVKPSSVTLVGTKEIHGREWQEGDAFSFALEQQLQDEDTWLQLDTKTVSFTPDVADFNRFDFSEALQKVSFDTIGTYTFRIRELPGQMEHMQYDPDKALFEIQVSDADMDGSLEISSVLALQKATLDRQNDKYVVSATFGNIFTPPVPDPEDIEVKVNVKKTVNNVGLKAIGPDGFEFVLENTISGAKLTAGSNGDGNAAFTLPFTAADIGKEFSYKLSEINDGREGVTYDTKVYNISVKITRDDDNRLQASIKMDGKEVSSVSAQFKNTYQAVSPSDTPETGDRSSAIFWMIVMISSALATLWLVIIDRKYSKNNII